MTVYKFLLTWQNSNYLARCMWMYAPGWGNLECYMVRHIGGDLEEYWTRRPL